LEAGSLWAIRTKSSARSALALKLLSKERVARFHKKSNPAPAIPPAAAPTIAPAGPPAIAPVTAPVAMVPVTLLANPFTASRPSFVLPFRKNGKSPFSARTFSAASSNRVRTSPITVASSEFAASRINSRIVAKASESFRIISAAISLSQWPTRAIVGANRRE
jgi:hypothetical protein